MKWWLVALHASDGVDIGLSFWTGLYALSSAPAVVLVAAVAGAVDLVFGLLAFYATFTDLLILPEVMCWFINQLCCWRQYRIGGSKLGHSCWLNGLGVHSQISMLEFLDSNGSTAATGGIGSMPAVAISWNSICRLPGTPGDTWL
ncbi:hypothetical protein Nepgr_007976 [Nepenthes gracilis]|uniref:Uncharacterized protein n=1 Tax=Nepenthes gracilis TaxID=150966 RepID=A0AAD3XJ10_NEPGR|nr:hypothetical protein Nepgr_007976 [Nepenthes gracilis]